MSDRAKPSYTIAQFACINIIEGTTMARLMTCKTCKAEISRQATFCPHCGHTYKRTFYQDFRRTQWGCLWIMVAAFILYAIISWSTSGSR
jgi:predicted amidophosphoribosyltransferase